jgi:hypothetical protein
MPRCRAALDVLNPDENKRSLPRPIPVARDDEIKKLLLQIIDQQ